jgi:4-carboxymuconolactone decarboxylase
LTVDEDRMDDEQRRANGLEVRREVLGDVHVDRAIAQTTPLTAEFQDLITRYAWGEIWTRPGLDIRSRRILVIGTMIAIGRWEEFQMHAAAALREGGFSVDDLKEIVLQQAIYCGVPAAHHALKLVAEHKTSQL